MDEQLDWIRLKNGDRSAFNRLFDLSYHPLCAFVSSIIKEEDVIEDIVMDCYTKLWEDRSNLNIQTSLQNYLITIVRNSAISYLRKNKHKNVDYEDLIIQTEEEGDPLQDARILNKLYEAINKLPEQRREILKKAAFDGKTYEEIAKELNISVNTVKTQMARGYKFLRNELKISQPALYFLLYF
ncbi:MAG: RNA polymerase sigma-70 factor [Bacteroidota bacterium]|nr:RNA polymerase sigma-70 factor [Bacteroidota bacterium]